MSALPTIGVLAPPRYPSFVKNSDLWQGVHLRRIGEFSRIPARIVGLEGYSGLLSQLAPLVVVRAAGVVDERIVKSLQGRFSERLKGYAVVSGRMLRDMQAVIGHGTFPVSLLPGERLPPLLWGPGLLPDDFKGPIPAWRAQSEVDYRRLLGRKAAGVFVTSDISVRLWNERIGVPPPERVFCLPYFVPALPRSEQVKAPPPRPDGVLNVLFVGAEARRKNLPRLIEACQLLLKRAPNSVQLTVVSDFRDGPVDVSAPFVRALGRRPNAEVLELMNQSHVMCVPSMRESFGMVYVEGLARGCVVVAPDRQQQRSLFGDAVLFADPGSAESIARALEQARSASLRDQLIEKGLQLYRDRYAPDRVATAFVEAALAIAR